MKTTEDMEQYAVAYRTALADELRAQREKRDVKFREISAETGMDVSQIHRYLSGKRDIPFTKLAALAEAIGVSLVEAMRKVEERIHQP